MRTIERTAKFRKDYKRETRNWPNLRALLSPIIEDLVAGKPLSVRLKDHVLIGNWQGHRECHVKPDLLLIYKISNDKLSLVRLGSHSELF